MCVSGVEIHMLGVAGEAQSCVHSQNTLKDVIITL